MKKFIEAKQEQLTCGNGGLVGEIKLIWLQLMLRFLVIE